MKFRDFECPRCGHRERQPANAVVHHPCPMIPTGRHKSRLVRLLEVETHDQ